MLSKDYSEFVLHENLFKKQKYQNNFCTGCTKKIVRGSILNFWRKINKRGFRNKNYRLTYRLCRLGPVRVVLKAELQLGQLLQNTECKYRLFMGLTLVSFLPFDPG